MTLKTHTPGQLAERCTFGPQIWHADAHGVYSPAMTPPANATPVEVWHIAYNIAPSEATVAGWVSRAWQQHQTSNA